MRAAGHTCDPFTFARDDIQRTPMVMQFLDNGGAQPYGRLDLYPDLDFGTDPQIVISGADELERMDQERDKLGRPRR